jgi:hypothetical protein
MRPASLTVFLLLTLALTARADACSCAPFKGTPREVAQAALDSADAVFVAKLRRTVVAPDPQESRMLVEDALFVVVEVIKGDLLLGQPVHVHQVVSDGSCGMSSTNDPVTWEDVVQPATEGSPGIVMPATFSKEWLIYAHGAEPYQLSSCSRSAPLNMGGEEELKLLRELVGDVPAKR